MKSVLVMTVMLPLLLAESPCPNDETSCILRHLLSQGLIRDDMSKYTRILNKFWYKAGNIFEKIPAPWYLTYFFRDKLTVSEAQGPEARANDFSAKETFKESLEVNNPEEGRSSRNSKYRPDCWEQEEAPPPEGRYRVRRGNYYPRGRQARGRQAPCLWETSYYMGDSGIN